MNQRAQAARIVLGVLQGHSLTQLLERHETDPLIQNLAFGVCRYFYRLDFFLQRLLQKPLKEKDQIVYALLLIGLYQLTQSKIPSHAAVSETVAATKDLKRPWAKGLVNAVLRNFQREQADLEEKAEKDTEAKYLHPHWLIKQIKTDWPKDWETILQANVQHPPMVLRTRENGSEQNVGGNSEAYSTNLPQQQGKYASSAVYLEQATPVEAIPGFQEGQVSIQDEAAQLAAGLLDLAPGQRILDACAAPGGKTAHILETQTALKELIALDINPDRVAKIAENLKRLHLEAQLITADASQVETWWDGQDFDRILLDAPCSSTGVIRRHSDIKLHRRPEDIEALAEQQSHLLHSLWPTLKPGGRLLYATCSILPQENSQVIQAFLAKQPDAIEQPIEATWGRPMPLGRQILPGEAGMDGFYYCALRKQKA